MGGFGVIGFTGAGLAAIGGVDGAGLTVWELSDDPHPVIAKAIIPKNAVVDILYINSLSVLT